VSESETDIERTCSQPWDLALPREVAAAQELLAENKKPPLKLEVEQEKTAFDFVEAHPELFNKGTMTS